MLNQIFFPPSTFRLISWHGRILQFLQICNISYKTTGKIKLLYTLGYKDYLPIFLPSHNFYFACKTYSFPQSCAQVAKNVISYTQNKTTGLSIKTRVYFHRGSKMLFTIKKVSSTKTTHSVLNRISYLFYLYNINTLQLCFVF